MLPSAEGCAAQLMKRMPLIELLQEFLGWLRLRRADTDAGYPRNDVQVSTRSIESKKRNRPATSNYQSNAPQERHPN
jgi:hypothetical protein